MAITSKSTLRDYIKRHLGFPIVQVEVTDEQMDDIISETIQEFSNFALEGELIKYYQMLIDGPCEITLNPSVNHILKISKGGGVSFGNFGGASFVMDYTTLVSSGIDFKDAIGSVVNLSATRSLLEKYFGDDLAFSYNPYKKKISVTESYHGYIMIEASHEYIPDENDLIFDNSWVKRMSVARCKLLQSDTVGKYDQSLIGGARINHDKMQSRAESEIEVLREELLNKWGGAAPILVG